MYRGLTANLVTSAPISAIYTSTYEAVKEALLPHMPPVNPLFLPPLLLNTGVYHE